MQSVKTDQMVYIDVWLYWLHMSEDPFFRNAAEILNACFWFLNGLGFLRPLKNIKNISLVSSKLLVGGGRKLEHLTYHCRMCHLTSDLSQA